MSEPVTLALLFGSVVLFFLAVTGLSRVYHAQQTSLGTRWFSRGVTDLMAQRFDPAVTDFRTALLYSRDNYSYQLKLAEALIGLRRTNEAHAYLINLWDREPENGVVNVELARIAAGKGETEQAIRYYHNAIYAPWPSNEETERRDARLELIEFLLRINAKTQAQSELIALGASLADDLSQQARLGDLFIKAEDYEHALVAYRLSLRSDRHNAAAMAGAGLAAFELGRYPTAQRYLQAAVAAAPNDTESADRLKITDLVLQLDPFRPQISVAQRNRIVVRAFLAAGQRLKSCAASNGPGTPATSQAVLEKEWTRLKAQITERGLRRDQDLVNTAMELVFNIERQSSGVCGAPSETDTALLLIAKSHEGS
jgi:tetratricopeptide (TPR) repeat protein